jgi:hypothetical protein
VEIIPSQVLARRMHFHFGRLKLIELFSDCCLILRCESCPRFVRPSIVVARAGHLNVIVESDNLNAQIISVWEIKEESRDEPFSL